MSAMLFHRRAAIALLVVMLVVPTAARGEILLPPGFTVQTYVTGEGFDTSERGARGLPSSSTLAIDNSGVLYIARTGRRYATGGVDYLWPVYRLHTGRR